MALALEAAPADRVAAADRSALPVGALAGGAAIVAAFAALVTAYLSARAGAAEWPPEGVKVDNYLGNTLAITMLMSSVTAEWAVWSVRRGERSHSIAAHLFTAMFGVAFAVGAWFGIDHAGFGAPDHPYAVVFFAILGLGIAAAAVGVVAMLVSAYRVAGGQVSASDPAHARATAILWHAIVIAWLIAHAAVFIHK